MSDTVEYTIKEIYEALEKDGFQHLRGEWTSHDIDGVVNGGCVLAQTAYNLGVVPSPEWGMTGPSLLEQLDALGTVSKDSPWAVYDSNGDILGLGQAIIRWNDQEDQDFYDNNEDYDPTYDPAKYVLETYADVAKMAYDVLKPYFDEKIVLAKKEWKLP